MSAQEIDITFFVPCLNEEENILPTIETILGAVGEVGLTYEILIIDDNSADGTVRVVEAYMKEHPEVNITLRKNAVTRGLGRNYVEGAYMGKGKYYMLVNGDNAEPKETIVAVIGRLGAADMVIPYLGKNDDRTLLRRALSSAFTSLVNLLGGYSVKYYNGPVAHFRFNVMRWHSDTEGFAYQAEIITRLLDEGATYVEVPISNFDRNIGVTKAFRFKNILSVTHSLLQIFLRRMRRVLFYEHYSSIHRHGKDRS